MQAVLDIVSRLAGFVDGKESIKGAQTIALAYAADLCFQLTVTREFEAESWIGAVVPALTPFLGSTEAHAVAEGARTRHTQLSA